MNRLSFAAFLLATTPLSAQAASLPGGYLSSEGRERAPGFGDLPSDLVQYVSGELRGQSLRFSALDFRPDGQFHEPAAQARSWGRVQLHLGSGDFDAAVRTFSSNFSAAPTLVYSGAMSWPDLSTPQFQVPMPWGYRGMSIPFQAAYSYAGTQDLVLQLSLENGVLAQSSNWQPNSVVRVSSNLDAVSFVDRSADLSVIGYHHCRPQNGVYLEADLHRPVLLTFADNTAEPNDRGQVVLQVQQVFGAPGQAHLGALGSQGVGLPAQGVQIGGCQPLMMSPQLIYGFQTDHLGFWFSQLLRIPYMPALAGTKVYAQSATDQAGIPHLSQMGLAVVQPKPANPPRTKVLRAFSYPGLPEGHWSVFAMPLIRLR